MCRVKSYDISTSAYEGGCRHTHSHNLNISSICYLANCTIISNAIIRRMLAYTLSEEDSLSLYTMLPKYFTILAKNLH